MSNPSYGSDKVNAFMKAWKEYNSSKENYIKHLTNFKTTTDEVIVDHSNAIPFSENSTDLMKNNKKTILTNERVIMKKRNSTIDNNSLNKLNINNDYISSMSFDPRKSNQSNSFVQLGLSDIDYDINTNKSAVHKFNNSEGEKHILSQGNCEMDSVRECDSYAKMLNKPYYGLSTNSDENECYCHTFNSSPGIHYTDNLITKETNINNISYLGVLFDGGLYGLKDNIYSKNYDNLYDYVSAKQDGRIQQIFAPSKINCNPFVGSNVNRITINDLGILRCQNK